MSAHTSESVLAEFTHFEHASEDFPYGIKRFRRNEACAALAEARNDAEFDARFAAQVIDTLRVGNPEYEHPFFDKIETSMIDCAVMEIQRLQTATAERDALLRGEGDGFVTMSVECGPDKRVPLLTLERNELRAERDALRAELARATTVDEMIRSTLHCWTCTRIKGGSASMCCGHPGVSVPLLKVFDAVRSATTETT